MTTAYGKDIREAKKTKRSLMESGRLYSGEEPPDHAVDLKRLFRKKPRVEYSPQEVKQEVKQGVEQECSRTFWCVPLYSGHKVQADRAYSGGFTQWQGPTVDMNLQVGQKTTVRVVGFHQSWNVINDESVRIQHPDSCGEYLTLEAIVPGTYKIKFNTYYRNMLNVNINAIEQKIEEKIEKEVKPEVKPEVETKHSCSGGVAKASHGDY